MSSFINQTNLSKENPNNHHPNMIMKQKSTLKGKKSGGLKVRKPLGQINANVGTTLKHNHSKNSGIKKQQKTFRKPYQVYEELISNYINFNKNTTILDVGCGNGEFFNYTKIRKKNLTYNGIDISNIMVDITNKRFGKNTAEIGTVKDINKDKKYDYFF